MKSDPLLTKAAFLAKKRNFEGAFRILKDEEDRYNGSIKYYYLYGVICLHAGNFVEAHESFQLAWRIKPKNKDIMLGIAVLHLRRMNTVQAVDYYLDIQEMDPKNKIAKIALAVIRKYSSSEALSEWMSAAGNVEKLFPPIPAPVLDFKTILKVVCILAVAAVITLGILVTVRVLPSPFNFREQRPTAEFTLSTQDRNTPVEVGGFYRYILTGNQAINLYDRALSLFAAYRDEAAKINLNRILESNASQGLKNRARLLKESMDVPGFDTFKRGDNPSYSEVKNELAVYRDVHVIWRGMATNVVVTDEYTRFDFLVGYDTRRTLEGIVPVVFYNPIAINTERPLEVLGRIVLASTYSDFSLNGVSIHQSGRLEN
jgi:tetratricopeptide (TPR) repeat protein